MEHIDLERIDHASIDRRVELALASWLANLGDNSLATRRDYHSLMDRFIELLQSAGLQLNSSYGLVKLAAERFAAQGEVSATTRNKRLSVLSSFYRHAIQSELLAPPNPIDYIKRPKRRPYARAQALDVGHLRRNLAAIDANTLMGARDYALLSVALITGRRLAELAALRCGELEQLSTGQIHITWLHCKGDQVMHDSLPLAVSHVLHDYLQRLYGPKLAELPAEAPIWISLSNHQRGHPLSLSAIADICEKRLGTSKVHRLRHTFARLMEESGAKVSEIQRRLGHASAATTSIYLQALHSDENPYAEAIEQTIGISF